MLAGNDLDLNPKAVRTACWRYDSPRPKSVRGATYGAVASAGLPKGPGS